MSNYPFLDNLRTGCFPKGILSATDAPGTPVSSALSAQGIVNWIQTKLFTRPRNNSCIMRHAENQGGLVVTETGDVEVRAGHKLLDTDVGASIVLKADGSVIITAPAGFHLAGDLKTHNDIYITGNFNTSGEFNSLPPPPNSPSQPTYYPVSSTAG